MENLIKRLEKEAGLTQEQAIKAIITIKDFMDKENVKVDWGKFVKDKYEDLTQMLKDIPNKVNEKAQPYTEKISEAIDSAVSKARKSAHDISQKAAEFFEEKKH